MANPVYIGTFEEVMGPKLIGGDGWNAEPFVQVYGSDALANLEVLSHRKEYWLREDGEITWRVPDVREAVRAPRGKRLFSADYSQIEVKIVAWLSQDPFLLAAVRSGKDVHSYMACEIFGIDYDQFIAIKENKDHPLHKLYSSIRSNVKAVVFGIIYGAGAAKVAFMTKMTEEEAQSFIDKFFEKASVLKAYLAKSAADAIASRQSRSAAGRVRWHEIPPRGDPNYRKILGQIERISGNMPIQCLAGASRIFVKGNGLVSISSKVGQSVDVWDGDRFSNAFVVASGKKRLLRLTFRGGQVLECSPDHQIKMATPKNKFVWRTAGWLLEKFAAASKQNRHNYRAVTSGPVTEDWSYNIPIPEAPSTYAPNGKYCDCRVLEHNLAEFGEWLGRIASDGSVYTAETGTGYTALLVANREAAIYHRLYRLTKAVNNDEIPKVREDARKSLREIKIWSSSLSRQLEAIGIKTCIPEAVWGNRIFLRGYLRGLFDGDGSVNKDNVVLTCGKALKRKEWFAEVQQALLFLGVRSKMGTYKNGFGKDGTPLTRINLVVQKYDVPAYVREIGFINPKKMVKARKIRGNPTKGVAAYGQARGLKSIVDTGQYEEMYDVVNSETGQFVANGIVVHNSTCADLLKRAIAFFFCALRGFAPDPASIPMFQSIHNNGGWTSPTIYDGSYLILAVHDELVGEGNEEDVGRSCDCKVKDKVRFRVHGCFGNCLGPLPQLLKLCMEKAYDDLVTEVKSRDEDGHLTTTEICIRDIPNRVDVAVSDYWSKE